MTTELSLVDATLDATMDEMAAKMAEQGERATALMAKDPQLSYISAIIIAGDMIQADRAFDRLASGAWDWKTASVRTGSYGRLDLRIRAHEAKLITDAQLLDGLADEWSGSDPDDTDPRMLDLWRTAWRQNGQRIVRQRGAKRELPRRSRLTVYRGQDPASRLDPSSLGIAWSLDRAIAEKFARGAATRQLNRYGVIYAAEIRRDRVLGWMPNRGEAEVVVDPRYLTDVRLVGAPIPAGIPEV